MIFEKEPCSDRIYHGVQDIVARYVFAFVGIYCLFVTFPVAKKFASLPL